MKTPEDIQILSINANQLGSVIRMKIGYSFKFSIGTLVDILYK